MRYCDGGKSRANIPVMHMWEFSDASCVRLSLSPPLILALLSERSPAARSPAAATGAHTLLMLMLLHETVALLPSRELVQCKHGMMATFIHEAVTRCCDAAAEQRSSRHASPSLALTVLVQSSPSLLCSADACVKVKCACVCVFVCEFQRLAHSAQRRSVLLETSGPEVRGGETSERLRRRWW